MKPFQILTLALAGLLLIVTWMDYKEKKNMNKFIMGAKKPCSCKDHGNEDPTIDQAPTDPGMSAIML